MFDKEGFKQYLMAQDKSQNTIDCYLRDVDELGGWASISLGIGVGELAQINLTYFKKKLKSEGYSIITVNFTDVVIPIGTRDTNILIVGTVLHEEDLMADLLKGRVPGVRSIKNLPY